MAPYSFTRANCWRRYSSCSSTCSLLLALDWFLQAPRWHKALLAGILLGASAIAMTVVLPFALVIAVYALIKLRRENSPARWSQLTLWGGIFAVGMALPIVPVAMYNADRGDPVLISYNGGINFYIGTGKDYDQKVGIRPGFAWQALAHEPIRLGHKKPSEQSSYFMRKGMDDILADPLGYVGLLGRKLYLFANGNEIMRNQEMYPFRQYSPLLAMLVWKWGIAFPFGVLFPLAIVGAVLALRTKQRRAYPMLLFIVSHILVLILFFVAARYRMNIVPFLIMLAVYAVWQVAAFVRDKAWGKTAWAGAGFRCADGVLQLGCGRHARPVQRRRLLQPGRGLHAQGQAGSRRHVRQGAGAGPRLSGGE